MNKFEVGFVLEFGLLCFILGFCASFFVSGGGGRENVLFSLRGFLFLFQPQHGQFIGGLVGILFQCSTFAYLGKKCWARASNFLISVGLAHFFLAGVGLSRQPAEWVFVAHVGAVVTGTRFVELARLRHHCVGIELCFRGLVLGFHRFLCFVE